MQPYAICLIKMTHKTKLILPHSSRRYQGKRLPLGHRVGSKNGLQVQTLQEAIWVVTKTGNAPILVLLHLGPLEPTPTDTTFKIKEKCQKWSKEGLYEMFYCNLLRSSKFIRNLYRVNMSVMPRKK